MMSGKKEFFILKKMENGNRELFGLKKMDSIYRFKEVKYASR